jgi:hypothetical protein
MAAIGIHASHEQIAPGALLGAMQEAEAAGFEVRKAGYLDVLGVLPYWLLYRLGGRDSIGGTSIWGYDRVIVPVSRLLQRVAPDRLLGKNVLLIATRR